LLADTAGNYNLGNNTFFTMDNFELKKTKIYKAVLLDKALFLRKASLLAFIFLATSFGFLLFFFVGNVFFREVENAVLGYTGLFFVLFLVFAQLDIFFKDYLTKPKRLIGVEEALSNIENVNIAEFLDFESARIIALAKKRGGADSYLLLLFLLKEAKEMDFIFYRLLIDKKQAIIDVENIFRERGTVQDVKYTECFLQTLKDALYITKERGGGVICKEDLFVALSKNNRYLQEILYRLGLQEEDVVTLAKWQIRVNKKENHWSYKNLIKRGRLGTEWASGHTPFLDNFSVDWTRAMKLAGFPDVVGHDKEAVSLERVLSRSEINSAILVGEPGAGRKSIIQRVIKKSFLGEGLSEINHHRFLELDLTALLAYAQGIEETEKLLDEAFNEATRAGNIILIINNLHNFVGGEQKLGTIDISGILTPYLHIPEFRLIGITSYENFHQEVEGNPGLLSLMEKVEVKEATKEDTMLLLQKKTTSLERKYRKLVSFAAIKKVIILSDRYIKNHPFPEKALDLLEEAVVHIHQRKESILMPQHVEEIVSERVEIPVGEVKEKEKETLLNMEELVHERMVNQEEAVKAVSLALRRSRADVDTRRGLIGSFLFLGPTGVGKTEMAKAIASVYFGAEKKINRIDMSEFQNISDISRLIGSSQNEGVLTTGIREDPFSLVLLDEIEKAHPDILNLFLQILDEGYITDGRGKKADFQNAMLIATSNAGYQVILDAVEQNMEWGEAKKKVLKNLFQKATFRPELVNRFDEVVLFKPLTKEDLEKVAQMQLTKLAQNLEKKSINFIITEELKKKIVEMSYDPVFGAREMQRAIQNNIGDVLSSAILKNEINSGDKFIINAEDFTLEKQ
jgi:ATP-dependent Clp protease ATP-binding subunit ClpC